MPAFAALQSKLSFKGRAALYKQRAARASRTAGFPTRVSNRNTDLKAHLFGSSLTEIHIYISDLSLFIFFYICLAPVTQPCLSPPLDLSCEKENISLIPGHQSTAGTAGHDGKGRRGKLGWLDDSYWADAPASQPSHCSSP